MATEIKMPQLGESVTEGTIGKWLKQPGDHVEKYEALLEVTTDKVDTEVPAPVDGILREIAVPEGTTVRVGTLLAVLDEPGGEAASDGGRATAQNEEARASNGQDQRSTVETLERSNTFVSPVVARLVAEHSLDLSGIAGTGAGGRVTKQDVLKFVEARKTGPAPASARASGAPARATYEPAIQEAATSGPQVGAPAEAKATAAPIATEAAGAAAPSAFDIPEDAEIVPLTAMRRSIAEHMVRSRRVAPHVTTVFELDVSRLAAHRERRKAEFERQGVKLTFTPYFVQAAVAALQAVPSVNASYSDEGIVMHRRIHVGVAVALEEGLIVPVLRDADEKNLLGLARAVNDLSERARGRRLKPDETQGGTFTITNHGVSGSLFAAPIINQPQAAILGVGAIQKRAVVITQNDVDAIAIRPMCYLSLTIDHRLLDGATADRFLGVMKEFLERYADS
ncbi:MAG: 2-oxo acid dehydrogenase subunit E2 [Kouleothrix sp.]|nr:2-oxo acid dehydrogenase subunit E2 [Kouleothrix sp.]